MCFYQIKYLIYLKCYYQLKYRMNQGFLLMLPTLDELQ